MLLPILLSFTAAPEPAPKCNAPVYMVVAGETHDRTRMMAYGKAIADSRLYEKLGGYYINSPLPVDTFEGEPAPSFVTLIVRFPCLANAQAFWNSEVYQTQIKPIREGDNPAGTYSVTVYPEIPVRGDMQGKVGDNGYSAEFDRTVISQTEPGKD